MVYNWHSVISLPSGEKTMRSRKIPSKTLVGALILCAAAILCIFRNEFLLPSAEGKCEVHFIDVGQGDAEFLRTENGCILIDAGTTDSRHDLVAYLEKYTEKIDYMILTHPHEDHIGGASEVIESLEVVNLIMPDAVSSSAAFSRLLDSVEKKGVDAHIAAPGDTYSVGDLQIEILSPLEESYENTNDYSAVVHARFGGVTFLFTGDAEAAVEKALLEEYPSSKLRSDVLKVGHHGSKTSSTEAFLNAVHPEIAVIEVGADNSYGHPSQKVLDRLDALGSRVYRTDISGNIVLTTDGDTIDAVTEKD